EGSRPRSPGAGFVITANSVYRTGITRSTLRIGSLWNCPGASPAVPERAVRNNLEGGTRPNPIFPNFQYSTEIAGSQGSKRDVKPRGGQVFSENRMPGTLRGDIIGELFCNIVKCDSVFSPVCERRGCRWYGSRSKTCQCWKS